MSLVPNTAQRGFLTGLALGVAACSGGGGDAGGTPATQLPSAPSPVLTSVSITLPASAPAALAPGQTVQLTASARDQSGNPIAAAVTWSSSALTVATVSGSGLVSAVGAGSATVTATAVAGATTVSSSVAISVVVPPVLTAVAVSGSTTLTVGGTSQLTATARDQFGATIAATLAWSTSNASRATVSATGLVTGLSAGSVTITVNATAGGVTVSNAVTLTVQAQPPVLTSVQITGGTSVTAGSTLQLTAAPKDQSGNPIAATVAWSSNATGIATVNGTGLVTGVSAGSANITALATMGSATASSFVTIAVNSPAFPSAATVNTPGSSFDPATVDIAVGGTVTWNITGIPHNVTFAGGAGAPANIGTGTGTDSRTFNTIGTFNYSCTLHIGMNGTVVVH